MLSWSRTDGGLQPPPGMTGSPAVQAGTGLGISDSRLGAALGWLAEATVGVDTSWPEACRHAAARARAGPARQ